jgi:hypothetical protein
VPEHCHLIRVPFTLRSFFRRWPVDQGFTQHSLIACRYNYGFAVQGCPRRTGVIAKTIV